MIVTTHHDLKAELKAAGWRIAKSGILDPINIADWYAWNPIRKSARDCCSNKKPPVVTVDPFEYTYNASAEIWLAGELPNGKWVDLRVYSIPMHEVMDTLPGALQVLESAWAAAWDAVASSDKGHHIEN